MKKKSIPFITLGICITILTHQTSVAQNWLLAGNSNATTSSKLGTTNAVPLRLFTNNAERLRIQTDGRVGIGITTPVNILTVKATGGTPASSWVTSSSPVFVGFAEAATSEFDLASASNTPDFRPVYTAKRSRGTLAAPTRVANNDYMMSLTSAAYDGSSFLSPVAINVYVDGTPTSGHVPARISFETGTSRSDRLERLKILNNGDIAFNSNQLVLKQATGNLGIGTNAPTKKLDVLGQTRVLADDASGTDVTTPFKIENTVSSGFYPNLTLYAGFNNEYTQLFGLGSGGLLVYGASGYQPIAASAFNVNSDITLKKDITHIKEPKDYEAYLTQIRAIDAITYRYKDEVATRGAKSGTSKVREELHVGFSAQSLPATIQTKIPASPSTKADIKLGYNLSDMAGLTLIGVKALDSKITMLAQNNEDLKKENEALQSNIEKQQAQINAILNKLEEVQLAQAACCKAAGMSGGNQPGNTVSASLDQNIPNPTANNSTRIGYNIPYGSLKAELTVTDNFGKKVKQLNLNNNGKGVLDMYTTNLAPGNYFYTLYVDGKFIETKKMIVTNTLK